jgi:hypothetical protein
MVRPSVESEKRMTFTVTIPEWALWAWLAIGVITYPCVWLMYRHTDNEPETVGVRFRRRWRSNPFQMFLGALVTIVLWPWAWWENR